MLGGLLEVGGVLVVGVVLVGEGGKLLAGVQGVVVVPVVPTVPPLGFVVPAVVEGEV